MKKKYVCKYKFITRKKRLGLYHYYKYKLWLIWFNLTY